MGSTALIIPINTLQGRLTSDPQERAEITQIKGALGLIPNIVIPAATIPMVTYFGRGDMSKGFMIVGIIYAVVYCLFTLTVYLGTRGYEPLEHLAEDTTVTLETRSEDLSIAVILKALLSNPPWLLCVGLYMVDMVFSSTASSVMTWYYQYNIGSIEVMSLVSSLSVVAALPVYLVMSTLIKRLGNSGTAALGCVICIAGYGIRFLLHDSSTAIILVGSMTHNFGACLVNASVALCIFDAKVYGEWKTGVDNEAILMSGYSVSYKTGQALGGPIGGYLLMTVPYVTQAAVQEKSVLDLWFYETTLMPAVGFMVALLCALRLRKYEKNVPWMNAEIEKRKAQLS